MGAGRENTPTRILYELVRLKDGPRDEHYREAKELVWAQARAALAFYSRPELDHQEPWRLGSHMPINVYEGDRPICQCHNAADADRIVEAVNGVAVAQQRIKLARDALVADGYFTESEVDDVAPRIVELCTYLRSQWDAALVELARVRSGRPVFRGERCD